eukprot:765768-Pelagomonas_calceolata.AAC.5
MVMRSTLKSSRSSDFVLGSPCTVMRSSSGHLRLTAEAHCWGAASQQAVLAARATMSLLLRVKGVDAFPC